MQSENAVTRRHFLQACAVGSGLFIVGAAASAGTAIAEEGLQGGSQQYGFLVDMTRCTGCEKCVVACRVHNNLSDDTPDRRQVRSFMDNRSHRVYASTSCMHCADPNCLRVCPAGAISKGEAGIVSVDPDRCIGCKYCFQACPYGVPKYNGVSMDKCDCCLGSGVVPGDTPHCVNACGFGALTYGTMEELKAEAARRHAEATPVGEECGPSCLLVTERG